MDAAIIMLLAMASVGLWTLRVAITSRGLRVPATAVAAVEAVVYVSAFGRLLEDLTAADRLLGFAVGVAAGTYLGMLIDQRFARRAQRALPPRPQHIHDLSKASHDRPPVDAPSGQPSAPRLKPCHPGRLPTTRLPRFRPRASPGEVRH